MYDQLERIAESKDMKMTYFVNAVITILLRREIDAIEREKESEEVLG